MDLNDIRSLIKEVTNENLFEAEVILRSDRNRNLTVVTDQLRAVCGITVITVTEPARPVSEMTEVTKLRCKFFLTSPTMREHLLKMSIAARKVPGVFSFQPNSATARKVINRIYR